MSEQNIHKIGIMVVINVIALYLYFYLFDSFITLYATIDDETIMILILLTLIPIILIMINFMLVAIMSIKEEGYDNIIKKVVIITLIAIILLTLLIFIYFLNGIGAFG
ncbi:MAG: membrane protein of unknown function [Promethearchaeota archaeon]|jgi:hypothetical protein|nr:MAG: membrane protein of unknown function [Candidatus Lokiarchaeota archaeon]